MTDDCLEQRGGAVRGSMTALNGDLAAECKDHLRQAAMEGSKEAGCGPSAFLEDVFLTVEREIKKGQ